MILWISPDICLVYTLVYREMMIVNYARKVMACRRKFNITALFVMCNYGECMLFPPHFVLITIPTWELRTENWLTKTRHRTRGMGWAERNITRIFYATVWGSPPFIVAFFSNKDWIIILFVHETSFLSSEMPQIKSQRAFKWWRPRYRGEVV